MADFTDEEEVYEYLAHLFRERGFAVQVKVGRGSQSPDADLLLSRGGKATAVEVKYFRSSPRFYEGLDEALALLLQGFDEVYLLHVFDSDIEGQAEEAASRAERIVRLTPVGYMVMTGRGEPRIIVEARGNPLRVQ